MISTGLYRPLRVVIVNNSLEKPYHSYGDHWVDGFKDAGCEVRVCSYESVRHLPLGYDLYFFVELRYDPSHIPWCITPRVLYSWDAHILGHDYYKPLTKGFDRIYLASKIDVEKLVQEGFKNVRWLPEACNPRVHRDLGKERIYQVGFVGNGNETIKRKGLSKNSFLNWLRDSDYQTCVKSGVWGDEYAKVMNQARIAFDRPIKHNVGTRLFEAAAMGCIPLTASTEFSDTNGIQDLMRSGLHYATYDDTLEGLKTVLSNMTGWKDGGGQFARQAQRHVLENHTYAHRAREVLSHTVPKIVELKGAQL